MVHARVAMLKLTAGAAGNSSPNARGRHCPGGMVHACVAMLTVAAHASAQTGRAGGSAEGGFTCHDLLHPRRLGSRKTAPYNDPGT